MKAIVNAGEDISYMFYAGEKKIDMWWEEFEPRLTATFLVANKYEGQKIPSR